MDKHTCVHHYMIDEQLKGTCKHCGFVRVFPKPVYEWEDYDRRHWNMMGTGVSRQSHEFARLEERRQRLRAEQAEYAAPYIGKEYDDYD